NRMSESLKRYRFLRDIRLKAVARGFFETVHYIFCNNERVEKYGFEKIEPKFELVNPITSDMDGLRPTLMINMLDSLKRNISISKRRVPLFEIGTVFDKKRNESLQMALAFCGEMEPDEVSNAGKPKNIDFPTFVSMLSSVIGEFELKECEERSGLMHPYQTADIYIEKRRVGSVAKLHPKAAEEFDLPDTYFAEIDLQMIEPKESVVGEISPLTPIYRDLSVVVPQSTRYSAIRSILEETLPPIVESFYPIDRYVDDSLGDDMSLTLRFLIAPIERSLEESEINAIMDEILRTLESRCGAKLR
ncbi:MAG: phenylalanine--tRNA ligase subunit beta, partial [Hydrogenimonas sp.]|nr:phenylalanine--tRNA ligase subunit beta [Hydrogenimonas sp.]